MREGGAAALSQSHGARPARQFLKPRLRGGPGRRAQALQGRQGVSAQRLGSRPKTHTRGGEEGGAEPTPRPGARLASSRPGARSGKRGAARAEGGVFPGRDCRENTGDPYSWSGESTEEGSRGNGPAAGWSGAGEPERGREAADGAGKREGRRTQRGRSRDVQARRGEAGRKERGARGWSARRAPHSPGGRGGWRWSRSCGPSHPSLEFERRELGMCGMRAGMRCAQLREGAGGSGGPATSPSGRRLGRGRGRGPRRGAGRSAAGGGGSRAGEGRGRRAGGRASRTSSFDLSFWIRPEPLPRTQTFPLIPRPDSSSSTSPRFLALRAESTTLFPRG